MSLPDSLPLPDKQARALRVVAAWRSRYKRGPSMQELAAGIGDAPTSNPVYVVRPLKAKGYLTKEFGRVHHALDLTERGHAWVAEDAHTRAAQELPLEPEQ